MLSLRSPLDGLPGTDCCIGGVFALARDQHGDSAPYLVGDAQNLVDGRRRNVEGGERAFVQRTAIGGGMVGAWDAAPATPGDSRIRWRRYRRVVTSPNRAAQVPQRARTAP